MKKIQAKMKELECLQHFSDAQGQLTPSSLMGSYRNLMSSKLSCMSSLTARMKIQLKMKALECSQDFPHYKSMGIFPDAQGQLTLQSTVGSN